MSLDNDTDKDSLSDVRCPRHKFKQKHTLRQLCSEAGRLNMLVFTALLSSAVDVMPRWQSWRREHAASMYHAL